MREIRHACFRLLFNKSVYVRSLDINSRDQRSIIYAAPELKFYNYPKHKAAYPRKFYHENYFF